MLSWPWTPSNFRSIYRKWWHRSSQAGGGTSSYLMNVKRGLPCVKLNVENIQNSSESLNGSMSYNVPGFFWKWHEAEKGSCGQRKTCNILQTWDQPSLLLPHGGRVRIHRLSRRTLPPPQPSPAQPVRRENSSDFTTEGIAASTPAQRSAAQSRHADLVQEITPSGSASIPSSV